LFLPEVSLNSEQSEESAQSAQFGQSEQSATLNFQTTALVMEAVFRWSRGKYIWA